MQLTLPGVLRVVCLGAAILLFVTSAMAQSQSPQDWLERMAVAAEQMKYSGTVVRLRGDNVETLHVDHYVDNGEVVERVMSLDGEGLEILRRGSEVQCIIADKKSILKEDWGDESTVFSTLPSSGISVGQQYDLAVVRADRVAGRKAVLLAIRPHDEFRYGHRLWLDKQTAFPLKTEMIGHEGSPIERVMFADVNLDADFAEDAFLPSVDISNFTTYQVDSARNVMELTDAGWSCGDLPPGFAVVSIEREVLPNTESPVIHIVYSDGLASISVFISENIDESLQERSSRGASSSYTLLRSGAQIVAIGEVPAITVERIARGMIKH